MREYTYEIYFDNVLVGDSGDMTFETKAEAKADAENYLSELADEYKRWRCEFNIKYN